MSLKHPCLKCGGKLRIRDSRKSKKNPLLKTEYLECLQASCQKRFKARLEIIYLVRKGFSKSDLARNIIYSALELSNKKGSCPDCGSKLRVLSSRQEHLFLRRQYLECKNKKCSKRYRKFFEINMEDKIWTFAEDDLPKPFTPREVSLPKAPAGLLKWGIIGRKALVEFPGRPKPRHDSNFKKWCPICNGDLRIDSFRDGDTGEILEEIVCSRPTCRAIFIGKRTIKPV